MLVEDTTAFIEQLEIRRVDRRSERHRRRLAHAEMAVLKAEWEARLALEAARKMEEELASQPEPAASSPARRLLAARRRRALEHRVESMRDRARAKKVEAQAARARLRELVAGGRREQPAPGAKLFRLHFAEHHLECSEGRFRRLARSQSDAPVLVDAKDGRRWWWYADRFWWDEDGLPARDVQIIVLDSDLAARQQAQELAEARAALLGDERRRAADAPLSPIVRFAVWCRDRGRCVDCGGAEDVRFEEILPPDAGGTRTVANVELRCDACRERRSSNQARARVSRAQIDVAYGL